MQTHRPRAWPPGSGPGLWGRVLHACCPCPGPCRLGKQTAPSLQALPLSRAPARWPCLSRGILARFDRSISCGAVGSLSLFIHLSGGRAASSPFSGTRGLVNSPAGSDVAGGYGGSQLGCGVWGRDGPLPARHLVTWVRPSSMEALRLPRRSPKLAGMRTAFQHCKAVGTPGTAQSPPLTPPLPLLLQVLRSLLTPEPPRSASLPSPSLGWGPRPPHGPAGPKTGCPPPPSLRAWPKGATCPQGLLFPPSHPAASGEHTAGRPWPPAPPHPIPALGLLAPPLVLAHLPTQACSQSPRTAR